MFKIQEGCEFNPQDGCSTPLPPKCWYLTTTQHSSQHRRQQRECWPLLKPQTVYIATYPRNATSRNGRSGLMDRFIGQSPGGSKGYWKNNTFTLRCSLYEFGEQVCTQSALGLSFCSVGLTSFCVFLSVFLSLRQVSVEPCRDHRLRRLLLRVSVFRCRVNNLYLSVVTERFLYVLPTNRCLCHNLGDVFQQTVT
jgi:hypothetical protein